MLERDIIGVNFKGYFQRDPAALPRELEEMTKSGLNEEAQAEHRRQMALHDKKTPFTLNFLKYDSETGSFVGSAEDEFGNSGIVGVINRGAIRFQKIYVREAIQLAGDGVHIVDNNFCYNPSTFRLIDYQGWIKKRDEEVFAGGIYRVNNSDSRLDGIWKMYTGTASEKQIERAFARTVLG